MASDGGTPGDPFPLFHLCDLDFAVSAELIPRLPAFQLALAPWSTAWTPDLEPALKRTWRRKRERARAQITQKAPCGVFAAADDRQKEQFPKFELIPLDFDLSQGEAALDALTSAQLAAIQFHPSGSKDLAFAAEDVRFSLALFLLFASPRAHARVVCPRADLLLAQGTRFCSRPLPPALHPAARSDRDRPSSSSATCGRSCRSGARPDACACAGSRSCGSCCCCTRSTGDRGASAGRTRATFAPSTSRVAADVCPHCSAYQHGAARCSCSCCFFLLLCRSSRSRSRCRPGSGSGSSSSSAADAASFARHEAARVRAGRVPSRDQRWPRIGGTRRRCCLLFVGRSAERRRSFAVEVERPVARTRSRSRP
jgi:hypothetical protein